MPQKSENTVHILEGQATLFQRPTSPVWHVRFKAHGKWERQTTKCEDLAAAKQKATDIVVDARFKEKNSLPIVNKRVKSVGKLAIRRLEALIASGRGKATYKTYIQAIEKYVIPLLGNHNIDKIDNAVLAKFEKQRIDIMGRTPSASVINNHNSALNQVFDEALERGYMTKFQVPLLRNDGIKTERRPDFTLDEYKQLYKHMRVWEREARKGNESVLRGVLRDYILVLANTGIRAGTEAMNLKWKHISQFEEKKVKYIALHVDGKTGQREVIARHSTAHYLNRLRCRTAAWAEGSFEDFLKLRKEDYVFRIDGKDMTGPFSKVFTRLLENAELLHDKKMGKKRTLYSLRHYYATMALTYERMSIYTLAKHMGTSVKMIEDHYAHVLLRKKAHEIAGGVSKNYQSKAKT
jgi:integrase